MTRRARGNQSKEVLDLLKSHLPAMSEILEHSRAKRAAVDAAGPRKVKECVAVMLVEEADGSETVLIVGDSDVEQLELKGVLHDGIYAFTHEGARALEVS